MGPKDQIEKIKKGQFGKNSMKRFIQIRKRAVEESFEFLKLNNLLFQASDKLIDHTEEEYKEVSDSLLSKFFTNS